MYIKILLFVLVFGLGACQKPGPNNSDKTPMSADQAENPATKGKTQNDENAHATHMEEEEDYQDPPPDVIVFDSTRLEEARAYCKRKRMSTKFALLANFSYHSGNYRLYGMNLETGDTILRGLVAHGHCKGPEGRLAQFSNQAKSNCSSIGHYKIRGKYTGEWGTSFKLKGLDATNSNAMRRYVVLHGHECIPDASTADDICLSEGCPTVSPNMLLSLEKIIDKSRRPIMLWIYTDEAPEGPRNPSTEELQAELYDEWEKEQ